MSKTSQMKFFTSIFTFLLLQLAVQAQLIEDWFVNTEIFPNGVRGIVLLDSENNVIVVREKSFGGSVNLDVVVRKFTPEGEFLWEVNDGDPFNEINFNAYDWTIDVNDNIILVGDQLNNTQSYWNSYIMKISPDGEVLWQHPVTNVTTWSEGLETVTTDENGFIYAAGTVYYDAVNTLWNAVVKLNPAGEVLSIEYIEDFYLESLEYQNQRIFGASNTSIMEFDNNGIELWEEPINYSSGSSYVSTLGLESIQKFNGNSCIVAHTVLDQNTYMANIGVKSFTLDGDEIWSIEVDAYEPAPAENENIVPIDFTIDTNGNVYVTGWYDGGGSGKSGDFGEEYQGIFTVAIAANGQFLWRNNVAVNLEETLDMNSWAVLFAGNQVLVVASSSDFENAYQNVYSYNAANGNLLWQDERSTIGTMYNPQPKYASVGDDEAIYISGIATSQEQEQIFYLAKYHIEPFEINSISENAHSVLLNLWPNPTQNNICLSSKKEMNEIKIVGADGRVVMAQNNFVSTTRTIDVSALSMGVYTAIVNTGNSIESVRFIKN